MRYQKPDMSKYNVTKNIDDIADVSVQMGTDFIVSAEATPNLYKAIYRLPYIERICFVMSGIGLSRHLTLLGLSQSTIMYRKKRAKYRLHFLLTWEDDPEIIEYMSSKVKITPDESVYLKGIYQTMNTSFVASFIGKKRAQVTTKVSHIINRIWADYTNDSSKYPLDSRAASSFWKWVSIMHDTPRILSPMGDLVKERIWSKYFSYGSKPQLESSVLCDNW